MSWYPQSFLNSPTADSRVFKKLKKTGFFIFSGKKREKLRRVPVRGRKNLRLNPIYVFNRKNFSQVCFSVLSIVFYENKFCDRVCRLFLISEKTTNVDFPGKCWKKWEFFSQQVAENLRFGPIFCLWSKMNLNWLLISLYHIFIVLEWYYVQILSLEHFEKND